MVKLTRPCSPKNNPLFPHLNFNKGSFFSGSDFEADLRTRQGSKLCILFETESERWCFSFGWKFQAIAEILIQCIWKISRFSTISLVVLLYIGVKYYITIQI